MKQRLLCKRCMFPIMALVLLSLFVTGIANLLQHADETLDAMSVKAYQDFADGNAGAMGSVYDRSGSVLWSPEQPAQRAFYSLLGAPYQMIQNGVIFQYQTELLGKEAYSAWQGAKSLNGSGSDLFLTLDGNAQKTVSNLLEANGVSGLVAACNASTGALRCLVSTPAAGPDEVVDTLPDGALLNKTLDTITPGSTMKLVTTALLIEQAEENIFTYRYTCHGSAPLAADGKVITCSTKQTEQDITSALGYSCNTFFANAIQTYLSPEETAKTLQRYGFMKEGKYSNLGKLNYETSSILFQDMTFSSVWSLIGQVSEVSPLDMLRFTSAVVHSGEAPTLYLVDRQSNRTHDKLLSQFEPEHQSIMAKETADTVKEIWFNSYDTYYDKSSYPDSITAAKTGTAEQGTRENKKINKLLLGYSQEKDLVFFIALKNWNIEMITPQTVSQVLLEQLAE